MDKKIVDSQKQSGSNSELDVRFKEEQSPVNIVDAEDDNDKVVEKKSIGEQTKVNLVFPNHKGEGEVDDRGIKGNLVKDIKKEMLVQESTGELLRGDLDQDKSVIEEGKDNVMVQESISEELRETLNKDNCVIEERSDTLLEEEGEEKLQTDLELEYSLEGKGKDSLVEVFDVEARKDSVVDVHDEEGTYVKVETSMEKAVKVDCVADTGNDSVVKQGVEAKDNLEVDAISEKVAEKDVVLENSIGQEVGKDLVVGECAGRESVANSVETRNNSEVNAISDVETRNNSEVDEMADVKTRNISTGEANADEETRDNSEVDIIADEDTMDNSVVDANEDADTRDNVEDETADVETMNNSEKDVIADVETMDNSEKDVLADVESMDSSEVGVIADEESWDNSEVDVLAEKEASKDSVTEISQGKEVQDDLSIQESTAEGDACLMVIANEAGETWKVMKEDSDDEEYQQSSGPGLKMKNLTVDLDRLKLPLDFTDTVEVVSKSEIVDSEINSCSEDGIKKEIERRRNTRRKCSQPRTTDPHYTFRNTKKGWKRYIKKQAVLSPDLCSLYDRSKTLSSSWKIKQPVKDENNSLVVQKVDGKICARFGEEILKVLQKSKGGMLQNYHQSFPSFSKEFASPEFYMYDNRPFSERFSDEIEERFETADDANKTGNVADEEYEASEYIDPFTGEIGGNSGKADEFLIETEVKQTKDSGFTNASNELKAQTQVTEHQGSTDDLEDTILKKDSQDSVKSEVSGDNFGKALDFGKEHSINMVTGNVEFTAGDENMRKREESKEKKEIADDLENVGKLIVKKKQLFNKIKRDVRKAFNLALSLKKYEDSGEKIFLHENGKHEHLSKKCISTMKSMIMFDMERNIVSSFEETKQLNKIMKWAIVKDVYITEYGIQVISEKVTDRLQQILYGHRNECSRSRHKKQTETVIDFIDAVNDVIDRMFNGNSSHSSGKDKQDEMVELMKKETTWLAEVNRRERQISEIGTHYTAGIRGSKDSNQAFCVGLQKEAEKTIKEMPKSMPAGINSSKGPNPALCVGFQKGAEKTIMEMTIAKKVKSCRLDCKKTVPPKKTLTQIELQYLGLKEAERLRGSNLKEQSLAVRKQLKTQIKKAAAFRNSASYSQDFMSDEDDRNDEPNSQVINQGVGYTRENSEVHVQITKIKGEPIDIEDTECYAKRYETDNLILVHDIGGKGPATYRSESEKDRKNMGTTNAPGSVSYNISTQTKLTSVDKTLLMNKHTSQIDTQMLGRLVGPFTYPIGESGIVSLQTQPPVGTMATLSSYTQATGSVTNSYVTVQLSSGALGSTGSGCMQSAVRYSSAPITRPVTVTGLTAGAGVRGARTPAPVVRPALRTPSPAVRHAQRTPSPVVLHTPSPVVRPVTIPVVASGSAPISSMQVMQIGSGQNYTLVRPTILPGSQSLFFNTGGVAQQFVIVPPGTQTVPQNLAQGLINVQPNVGPNIQNVQQSQVPGGKILIAGLQNNQQTHIQGIQTLQHTHVQGIQSLQQSHIQGIQSLQQSHVQGLQSLQQTHVQGMQSLQQSHIQVVQSLQQNQASLSTSGPVYMIVDSQAGLNPTTVASQSTCASLQTEKDDCDNLQPKILNVFSMKESDFDSGNINTDYIKMEEESDNETSENVDYTTAANVVFKPTEAACQIEGCCVVSQRDIRQGFAAYGRETRKSNKSVELVEFSYLLSQVLDAESIHFSRDKAPNKKPPYIMSDRCILANVVDVLKIVKLPITLEAVKLVCLFMKKIADVKSYLITISNLTQVLSFVHRWATKSSNPDLFFEPSQPHRELFYNCQICGRSFRSQITFEKHAVEHKTFFETKTKEIKDEHVFHHCNPSFCLFCERYFKSSSEFHGHYKWPCSKNVPPPLSLLTEAKENTVLKLTSGTDSLQKNVKLKSGLLDVNLFSRNSYYFKASEAKNAPVECCLCSKVCNSFQLLKDHITLHGKMNEILLVCNKCNINFGGNALEFFDHVELHDAGDPGCPFICNLCQMSFWASASMVVHYSVSHQKMRLPWRFSGASKVGKQMLDLNLKIEPSNPVMSTCSLPFSSNEEKGKEKVNMPRLDRLLEVSDALPAKKHSSVAGDVNKTETTDSRTTEGSGGGSGQIKVAIENRKTELAKKKMALLLELKKRKEELEKIVAARNANKDPSEELHVEIFKDHVPMDAKEGNEQGNEDGLRNLAESQTEGGSGRKGRKRKKCTRKKHVKKTSKTTKRKSTEPVPPIEESQKIKASLFKVIPDSSDLNEIGSFDDVMNSLAQEREQTTEEAKHGADGTCVYNADDMEPVVKLARLDDGSVKSKLRTSGVKTNIDLNKTYSVSDVLENQDMYTDLTDVYVKLNRLQPKQCSR